MIKKILLTFFGFVIALSASAQILTSIQGGGSTKASVSERIGITDVSIRYDRPGVKGREGKIWGNLVPYGFTDQGFGTSKAAPWRAGANENTIFTFSTDVMIEGKPLAAGSYGFFVDMEEGNANIIFSRNTGSWGSFFYDPKEDALRVNVKNVPLTESVERLKYEFMNQKDNSAVVALQWEKMKIPFTVSVDYVKTQMESYRRELRSNKGFNPDAYIEAINFSLANNVNPEEALTWSDYAINGVFVGQKNFKTLSTKAKVLNKLNRKAEADALMKEAMPMASMQDLHQYARQLLRERKNAEALEAFKINGQKYPNVFTTNMGLMRGYSASGDYINALKYAKAALPQAPDAANKTAIENFIKMLGEGNDIN